MAFDRVAWALLFDNPGSNLDEDLPVFEKSLIIRGFTEFCLAIMRAQ